MKTVTFAIVMLFAAKAYALPECEGTTKVVIRYWNRNINHAAPQLQLLQSNHAGVGRGLEWFYDLKTGAPISSFRSQQSILAKCVGASSNVMNELFPMPSLAQGQGCFLTWKAQGETYSIAIKTMGSRLKAVAVFEGLGNNTHRGLCEFREAP